MGGCQEPGGVQTMTADRSAESGAFDHQPSLNGAASRGSAPHVVADELVPHVVVVGGGLAGLAAGLAAADAGLKVTLLERRNRLGGATWSFERNGINYDNGQHVFMRCFTSYRAFLSRIGSSHKVHLQPRLDVPVLSSNGKLGSIKRSSLPAPLHLIRALLSYPHLSFKERLSAMRTALALRKLGKLLPPDIAPKPCEPIFRPTPRATDSDFDSKHHVKADQLSDLDSQTFGSWLREKGESSNAIQKLWNLIVLPTANLPADQVSLLLATRVFGAGLLTSAPASDIGWSEVPLSELHAEAAAKALLKTGAQVRTQAAAQKITADPLGVELSDGFLAADAVIAAVPHTAADSLLPAEAVAQQAQLRDLGESPIINVHIVYDEPVCEFSFLGTVDSEAQFVFDRTSSAGLTDGRQCLGVSLSAADEYLPLKPQELIDHMAAELEALLPGARGVKRSQEMVTKEVAATFRGTPGSNSLRPSQPTSIPGVFLAGAWTDTGWPATMEGAVRSGILAANYALGFLRNGAGSSQNGSSQGESGTEAVADEDREDKIVADKSLAGLTQ